MKIVQDKINLGQKEVILAYPTILIDNIHTQVLEAFLKHWFHKEGEAFNVHPPRFPSLSTLLKEMSGLL